LRSVSAAIFSSARARAVSRVFSVLLSAVLAFDQGGARLLKILDLLLARFVGSPDLGHALFRVIACDRSFHGFGIEGSYFLGTRDQVLSRLGQQPLGGSGTRLQGVKPHVHAVTFGLLLLLGFVERG
jgi:hypothetical protein